MIRADQLEPHQPRNGRALEHNSWRNIAITLTDHVRKFSKRSDYSNSQMRRGNRTHGPLVELIELDGGHRGNCLVRVFVEAIQCDMLHQRHMSGVHESPHDNSEGTVRLGLHDYSNRRRARINCQALDWAVRQRFNELPKLFELELP